jgi:hypothetical protein
MIQHRHPFDDDIRSIPPLSPPPPLFLAHPQCLHARVSIDRSIIRHNVVTSATGLEDGLESCEQKAHAGLSYEQRGLTLTLGASTAAETACPPIIPTTSKHDSRPTRDISMIVRHLERNIKAASFESERGEKPDCWVGRRSFCAGI